MLTASWSRFVDAAPVLAAEVEARFRSRRHHVMATVRVDGSPRLSGTEVQFADGELRLGMMPGAVRAADLRRDPRLAVHSQGVDPPEGDPGAWSGEAKVAGRARWVSGAEPAGADAVEGAPPDGEYVAIEVTEVVLTRIGAPADHLVIEWWTPQGGLRCAERR